MLRVLLGRTQFGGPGAGWLLKDTETDGKELKEICAVMNGPQFITGVSLPLYVAEKSREPGVGRV